MDFEVRDFKVIPEGQPTPTPPAISLPNPAVQGQERPSFGRRVEDALRSFNRRILFLVGSFWLLVLAVVGAKLAWRFLFWALERI